MTKTIFEIRETIEGLKKDRNRLIEREKKLSIFSLFDTEDKETVRPEYDFERYQEKIDGLNNRIRSLSKEALSYIVNTKVAECGDMTILDALLYVEENKKKKPPSTAAKRKTRRFRRVLLNSDIKILYFSAAYQNRCKAFCEYELPFSG